MPSLTPLGQHGRITDATSGDLDGSNLDTCSVDQQAQRLLRAAIGNVHGRGLLSSAQHAEGRQHLVETNQAQQALDEACGLPRATEEGFPRQPRLDIAIAALWLPVSIARWRRHPAHVGIGLPT